MQHNDDDEPHPEIGFQGWAARQPVVTQYVRQAMDDAVRITRQTLDAPSETAIMRVFQTIIDRTSFTEDASTPGPSMRH